MRVLVACEFSGIVRDAFLRRGHEAVSCDRVASDRPGPHVRGDVRRILGDGWDLMIAHPPCTYLAISGGRWFKDRFEHQRRALEFVRVLLEAPIPRICLENPKSIISTRFRKPEQIIQPWMFGHGEVKTTCLWLKGLPPLEPTNVVEGREPRVHMLYYDNNRERRKRERSRTYEGIAEAMADQWGEQRRGGGFRGLW